MMKQKIQEKYPSLEAVTIKFRYKDFDTENLTDEQERSFTRDNYIPDQFKCPYWECIDGGHNLHIIENLVNQNITNIKGEIRCNGWQDKERIGKHRCNCTLIYEIDIIYSLIKKQDTKK